MKWVVLLGLGLVGIGGWVWLNRSGIEREVGDGVRVQEPQREVTESDQELREVIAGGLEVPWAVAFLPDGGMMVTERLGRIRFINTQGELRDQPLITIDEVRVQGEGGLLGIAVHPEYEENGWVYVYYTYQERGGNTLNRVVRMVYGEGRLHVDRTIIEAIPGANNHNGGRIAFGPDGYLYIGTGDAQVQSLAQDAESLAGKILRVGEDGSIPEDNPFGSAIWSYGHRNVQGFTWDDAGRMWATEHGRSGLLSGLDEVNLIERGKNYGWPLIEGDEEREGMERAVVHSGAATTWAPAGAAFVNGSVYFGGLRGRTLYEAVLEGERVVEVREHLVGDYGRIREVIRGSENELYITTSNRDGRGQPHAEDDRIIRIQVGDL